MTTTRTLHTLVAALSDADRDVLDALTEDAGATEAAAFAVACGVDYLEVLAVVAEADAHTALEVRQAINEQYPWMEVLWNDDAIKTNACACSAISVGALSQRDG